MRSMLICAVLAAGLALAGCVEVPDEEQEEGGSGGMVDPGTGGTGGVGGVGGEGGSGGSGPSICEQACTMLAACDSEYLVEECVAGCEESLADGMPVECVTCIAGATCDTYQDVCQEACFGPEPEWHDLTIEGAGLAAYDGKTIFVSIVDAEYDEIYDYYSWTLGVDTATDFSVTFEEVFWDGSLFYVDVFIDANDNSVCDATGDVAWRIELGEVAADATVRIDPSVPTFGGACESFAWLPMDLTVEGTGFEANEGATAVIAVYEVYSEGEWTDEWQVAETSATIVNGAFSVTLPQAVYGDSSVRVKWFVDANASGHCESSDPGGATFLQGPFSAAPVASISPATPAEAAVCTEFPGYGFDISLQASGFDAYNGKEVVALLFDSAGNYVEEGYSVVRLGAFELLFPGDAQYGESYTIGWFIDVDGDWSCAIPGDGAWSIDVGQVDGDEALTTGLPSEMDEAMCSYFSWGEGVIEE